MVTKIALASNSRVKFEAISRVWGEDNVTKFKIKDVPMAAQPMGVFGKLGAEIRYKKLLEEEKEFIKSDFDYIISVENSIYNKEEMYYERCDVIIYDIADNKPYYGILDVPLDTRKYDIRDFILLAQERTPDDYKFKEYGYAVTIGDMLHEKYSRIKHNNWIQDFNGYGFDRVGQIVEAMKIPCLNLEIKKSIYRNVDKKGKSYKDISPLFFNNILYGQLVSSCAIYLGKKYGEVINKRRVIKNKAIVSFKPNSYVFGSSLAVTLNLPFINIRKNNDGKFYMPPNYSLNKECDYIIVDDVVATGNSILSVSKLLETEGGGSVSEILVLTDITELREIYNKLLSKYEVKIWL